jgi:hypothetical protein
MLKEVNKEMQKVDEEMGVLINRQNSLDLIKENLLGYTNGVTVTLVKDTMTEPIPNLRDIVPKKKRHISAAGKRAISRAQKARWAKVRAAKK